jgi:hypothetical protein
MRRETRSERGRELLLGYTKAALGRRKLGHFQT